MLAMRLLEAGLHQDLQEDQHHAIPVVKTEPTNTVTGSSQLGSLIHENDIQRTELESTGTGPIVCGQNGGLGSGTGETLPRGGAATPTALPSSVVQPKAWSESGHKTRIPRVHHCLARN